MSRGYILGLDIGTTKVCAVVARVSGGEAEVTGFATAEARGTDRGTVVDMESAAAALGEAVQEAEASSGVRLRAAYVGVAGEHVKCHESYGATAIRGDEVTQRDVDRVIDSASTLYVPLDRDVLHVLPAYYSIDGQKGILRPKGMSGVRLEADVRVVTASQSAVDNLLRCCEMAGLSVVEPVFEPIASCKAVARDYEARQGVALVDIGGGTTDVAVYKDGVLADAFTLPLGGDNLTRDLAIGLRLPFAEAEEVKITYGHALEAEGGPEEIEVPGLDGSIKRIPMRYLRKIILPRCEEIFELIEAGISRALLYTSSSCVVITGGTALLSGIDRVAEAKLGLPVRTGIPEYAGKTFAFEGLDSPIYSTGVGLVLYGLERERSSYDELFSGVREKFSKVKNGLSGALEWGFGYRRNQSRWARGVRF